MKHIRKDSFTGDEGLEKQSAFLGMKNCLKIENKWNQYTKLNQTYRQKKKKKYGHQRGEGHGEKQIRSLGLTDTKYYM